MRGAASEPEECSGERPLDVVVTIQHPAHVHLFRNPIRMLQQRGDEVTVFARRKDVATELLERYGIEHTVLAGRASSLAELALRQVQYEAGLLWRARRLDPDVMVAMGEPGVAHVSTLLGCPGVIFTDTENARLQNALAFPLAERVCTPACYRDDLGDKQVCYEGYHELAYLHPERFTPRPDVLDHHGLTPDSSFAVVRLNAFNAAHARGDAGFADVRRVVRRIETTGTDVVVTAEPELPPGLAEYEASVPPERMHDLLYYADLLVGESATMASESAVLGTPAIFVSTSRRGYTDELADRYGLVYPFSGPDRQRAALDRAVSILRDDDAERWQRRRERLLEDKVDTAEFVVEQVDAAVSDCESRCDDSSSNLGTVELPPTDG